MKIAFCAILPLLKLVPLFEVTVCAAASLLVHITISPTRTVNVDGEKAKPLILILKVAGPAGEVVKLT